MKAPFPWFGGKSRVAHIVWDRFGAPANYVEPFFGSGAVLLNRPTAPGVETVNDLDCMVANFWRALQVDAEAVAFYADWPVNEADQHARHLWLVSQAEFRERMKTDPEYFDAKIAGWWVWGQCIWIGSGWCAAKAERADGTPWRSLPHIKDAGTGVHRKLPHIRGAGREAVCVSDRTSGSLLDYMAQLAARLRRVRVCCGDWTRICGPSPTTKLGTTAVFLDPPYSDEAERDSDIYVTDSGTVAHEVREWAIANGDNPDMRIALCGYEGEHAMPASWDCLAWKARGGYGSQGNGSGRENAARERIWFSPHCLHPQSSLFANDADCGTIAAYPA